MEILGVGPSELVFIIILAIIVLGPRDMQKAGRTIGRWLNQASHSDLWKLVRDTSSELSNMPRKWMREANMELWEAEKDLQNKIDPQPRTSLRSQPRPNLYQQPTPPKTSANAQPEDESVEEPPTPNE